MSVSLHAIRTLGIPPVEILRVFSDLLNEVGVASALVGSSIGFKVHGSGGGCWILDLRSTSGGFVEADPRAFAATQTQVYAFASDLAALLIAPEAATGLMETGRLIVEGERRVLRRLANLIRAAGGRSPVSVRSRGIR